MMGFLHNLWSNPGPDTGWSWVIALSSSWIQFEMLWILRSSGLLFTSVIQMFGVSREEAALPFAVFSFSVFFPGIFASMLMQFFSERQIVAGGILIASVGLSMCYFARSILWITVCMGFVSGFCSGISVTPLTVLLSHYFDKSRTTANGILLAGRSIGGFVFPPLAFVLLNFYGLRGTFMLMGAIMSNSLIAAALLRPRNRINFAERLTCNDQEQIQSFIHRQGKADVTTIAKTDHRNIASGKVNQPLAEEVEDLNNQNLAVAFPKPKRKEPSESLELFITSKNPRSQSVLKRFSVFWWNCLKIVKDPVYILTATSDTFFSFSNISLLLVLLDYLTDIGFSKEFCVTLLMVQSISDQIARIFSGFITDRGYLTRQASISITFFVYGATFFFLTVFNVSYLFVCNSILFGFFGGCSLINIVAFYSQHLTREEMPIGIGLSCTFKGLSFLLQSALVGYFRDKIGSYVPLFYLFSSVAFAFSSLWLILALKDKWKNWNSIRGTANERKEYE